MTDAQNSYRTAAGVGLLTWSDELAAFAQAWADAKGPTQTLQHNPNIYPTALGEVMAFWLGAPVNSVVDMWAQSTLGHYEIMTDSGFTALGCGYNNGIWVCDYR
jgi:uncharacterized protein YkwD